jgi:DNA polymerase (family 10)
MLNKEIGKIFRLTADLLELHGENPFKVKSYANAAFRIEKLDRPLSETNDEDIQSMDGIGKGLAQKIHELKETGSMQELNRLMEITPEGLIEMLNIKGIGAKKTAVIWKSLGIETVAELLYACNENRLIEIKGFGEKTQQAIIEAISFAAFNSGKYHYALLEQIALNLLKDLSKSGIQPLSFTGELRRKTEILDKIEFISISDNKKTLLDFFNTYADIDLSNEILCDEKGIHLSVFKNIPLHIYLVNETDYFSQLFITTGNEDHLKLIPEIPQNAISEQAIYAQNKLAFIEPEMREGLHEVELAKNNSLPKLIETGDLKGILHNHSNYSDGLHTLKQMAVYCKELGYEYLGICDHSQSAFYANGLKPDRVFEQHREIESLNQELSPFRIFKGIESDILNDGSLDYTDDVLSQFDFIVASVHSNLKMPEEKANARLLKAIENPYTTILGHPTGRLLLARAGYPIDHKKIIDACAEYGVVIELNAHPYRLDLDWRWIHYAVSKGVKISINPDAHQMKGFHDMYYGICVARKAGLEIRDTLNAMDLREITNYFSEARLSKEKRSGLQRTI